MKKREREEGREVEAGWPWPSGERGSKDKSKKLREKREREEREGEHPLIWWAGLLVCSQVTVGQAYLAMVT